MPYRYLEEVATADIAFEAWDKSLDGLFITSADAAMNVMVEDLSTIDRKERLTIEARNSELDLLLFDFLNELVYLKDARRLLLRVGEVRVEKKADGYYVRAEASGEPLDPKKHPLRADVKAVTLHMLSVKETKEGWRATVVLDI